MERSGPIKKLLNVELLAYFCLVCRFRLLSEERSLLTNFAKNTRLCEQLSLELLLQTCLSRNRSEVRFKNIFYDSIRQRLEK